MRLSDLKTIDEVVEERRRADPAFAAEWERTAHEREPEQEQEGVPGERDADRG